MERRDEELEREREVDEQRVLNADPDLADEHETHATTGGAAAAGAITGGVIGLTGGPLGAAIGAVGGALVGAAAERMMHGEEFAEPEGTAEREASDATPDTAPPPAEGRGDDEPDR